MKKYSKRLNPKGFSHIEILVVVAVVVVVALAGFFVYKHDHKNSTVHAATGWSWLGDGIIYGAKDQAGAPLINFYACLQTVQVPSGVLHTVDGLAISNIRITGPIRAAMFDNDAETGTMSTRWFVQSDSWNNQMAKFSHSVNISQMNFINSYLYTVGGVGNIKWGKNSPSNLHALALANCAG